MTLPPWLTSTELVIGLVAGAVVALVVEHLLPALARRTGRIWHRGRRARRDRRLGRSAELLLGERGVFVAQFHPSGIRRAHVHTSLRPATPLDELVHEGGEVSDEPEMGVDDLARMVEARAEALDAAADAWNGRSLALRHMEIARAGDTEAPELTMTFEPSDHAHALVLKRFWMASQPGSGSSGDDWRKVRRAFSHGFGLNATVETADGKLLLTVRGAKTFQHQGRRHISINEGMRPDDIDVKGDPDPWRTLVRGIREELGMVVPKETLTVHRLILDVDRYEWAFLAHVDLRGTDHTAAEIVAQRRLGVAPDDWEAARLEHVDLNPSSLLGILRTGPHGWVPHGYVNLALSAVHRFPRHAERFLSELSRHELPVGDSDADAARRGGVNRPEPHGGG